MVHGFLATTWNSLAIAPLAPQYRCHRLGADWLLERQYAGCIDRHLSASWQPYQPHRADNPNHFGSSTLNRHVAVLYGNPVRFAVNINDILSRRDARLSLPRSPSAFRRLRRPALFSVQRRRSRFQSSACLCSTPARRQRQRTTPPMRQVLRQSAGGHSPRLAPNRRSRGPADASAKMVGNGRLPGNGTAVGCCTCARHCSKSSATSPAD